MSATLLAGSDRHCCRVRATSIYFMKRFSKRPSPFSSTALYTDVHIRFQMGIQHALKPRVTKRMSLQKSKENYAQKRTAPP